MSYIEIKTINGRRYKYLRKTVREGKRMKHLSLKYLGPMEPIYKVDKSRKSNASIYIRKLSKNEEKSLLFAAKSNNSFTKDRARILLLSSKKFFAEQIAKKVFCDARKVRRAIKAFNRNGLKALERGKAKGAVPKFTENNKKEILKRFAKEPKKFGYPITTWTLPRFRKHLIESKAVDSISIETLRQILMKAGAKLKRNKRWQYSNDKEFLKKNVK